MGAYWISNYDEAKAYLAGGRKKWDRPMYMRGLRLQQRGKDIAIMDRWYGVDTILFHPDGTLTIQAPTNVPTHWGTWNTLRSQSVRYTIRQFSGIQNLFIRQGVAYIVESDAGITPPKIQKCRQCKGYGKVDRWCYPDYCRNTYPCTDHPEWKPSPGGHSAYWHYGRCEHGHKDSHVMPKGGDCYSCSGVGKRDYGSQYVKVAWDGSPLKLSNGKIVKQPPTELEKAIAAYVKPIS